jgi:hypothetical protein
MENIMADPIHINPDDDAFHFKSDTTGQPQDTATISTALGDQTFQVVNDANLNQLWGDIAHQVAESGIMGEHTREGADFTPDAGSGGRIGVGNVSMDIFGGVDGTTGTGALADGAQGVHATTNGALLGDTLPSDFIESTVGPFTPDPHGVVTVVDPLHDFLII